MQFKLVRITSYWAEIRFGDQVVAHCGQGGLQQNWWYVITIDKKFVSEGHATVEDALNSYIENMKKTSGESDAIPK